MNDNDPVREKLQAWNVAPPISKHFSAEVWDRIRKREEERSSVGWAAFIRWLLPSRAAWQLAAVACAIVVAAGAGWGSHTGRTATERNYADLAARYAESIDPYLQVSRASAK